jgi:hypothetical protein
MTNNNRILSGALAAILLTACASSPPSDAVFQSATRAIEAAERAGAEDLSPVELRFARERLAQARTLADQGQSEEALMAIERSEINAELAIEQSRTALERRRVNELRRSNELLLEELVGLYGEDLMP